MVGYRVMLSSLDKVDLEIYLNVLEALSKSAQRDPHVLSAFIDVVTERKNMTDRLRQAIKNARYVCEED